VICATKKIRRADGDCSATLRQPQIALLTLQMSILKISHTASPCFPSIQPVLVLIIAANTASPAPHLAMTKLLLLPLTVRQGTDVPTSRLTTSYSRKFSTLPSSRLSIEPSQDLPARTAMRLTNAKTQFWQELLPANLETALILVRHFKIGWVECVSLLRQSIKIAERTINSHEDMSHEY
jgi:hypothetical protein